MQNKQKPSLGLKFFRFRIEAQSKVYLGYRVGLIVSVLHAYFLLNGKSFLKIIASAIKKIVTTPVLSEIHVDGQVGLYYSIPRADYLEIMDFVRGEFASKGIDLEKPCLLSHRERVSTLGEMFSCLKPALKLAYSHQGSAHERFYVFASYFFLLKGFFVLERSDFRIPTKAVFFNSSNFPESMLCEFFRSQGIKTYSMQHGMYLRMKHIPYDIINYSNVTADILLCWGAASKQEIELFYRENHLNMEFRCEIAGYPRHSSAVEANINFTNKILILLPRAIYKKESINLLRLLVQLRCGEEFIIKPHPSLLGDTKLEALYVSLSASVDTRKLSECLGTNKYRAVIGFNSTSVFEAISNTRTILHYSSGRDEFLVNIFDSFSTSDDLILLLKNMNEARPKDASSHEYYFGTQRREYFNLISL